MAWAPLPSAVSGGQQPGRMTRQVPTALFIVWSLARLELDTVVLVRVHWALACGTACLPLPPGAPLPGLSPASRSRGLRMVTWWLGFRWHLTSSLTPRALPACCPGLFPDSLGWAVQAVGWLCEGQAKPHWARDLRPPCSCAPRLRSASPQRTWPCLGTGTRGHGQPAAGREQCWARGVPFRCLPLPAGAGEGQGGLALGSWSCSPPEAAPGLLVTLSSGQAWRRAPSLVRAPGPSGVGAKALEQAARAVPPL